jgi:hypothetical protein
VFLKFISASSPLTPKLGQVSELLNNAGIAVRTSKPNFIDNSCSYVYLLFDLHPTYARPTCFLFSLSELPEIVTSLVEIPAAGSSGGGKHDAGNFPDNTRRPQSLPRGNVSDAVGGIANHAQAASNPAQGAHSLPPTDTQVPAHPTHPQTTIAPFSHILATV